MALRVQLQPGSASIFCTRRPGISRGCERTQSQRSKTGPQPKVLSCFKASRKPERSDLTYVESRLRNA